MAQFLIIKTRFPEQVIGVLSNHKGGGAYKKMNNDFVAFNIDYLTHGDELGKEISEKLRTESYGIFYVSSIDASYFYCHKNGEVIRLIFTSSEFDTIDEGDKLEDENFNVEDFNYHDVLMPYLEKREIISPKFYIGEGWTDI